MINAWWPRYKLKEKPFDESYMEIKTHVLTNPQDLDSDRKEQARKNIAAIGSIAVHGETVTPAAGEDSVDLSGYTVPTPSTANKVLTSGEDGSFGWSDSQAPTKYLVDASAAGDTLTIQKSDGNEFQFKGQENVIESISVNGEAQTVDNKNVNIQIASPVQPYNDVPAMDSGEGRSGSTLAYAKGDHVHPSDTSKANKSEMAITAVQGDASKKNIQLKAGLSQDVVVAHQDISGKEDNSNKVSVWSETTTDVHYPSEKLVKGSLDQKEDKSNKVTAWANQPTDTSYPSEKLTKDSLDTKANKSEMSVTTDSDQTTITLKEGTSATVINAHQNVSGKADKSEMTIEDVAGDNTKKKITLKDGLSQDVVVAHQDLSGKADKVSGATNGNLAGLDGNGNLINSGKTASDFATAAQGTKADSAVQSVKMSSSEGTELKNGTSVVIPEATQNAPGVMSTSDKTKLDGIAEGANAYTHPSHTAHNSGMYKVTIDAQGHVSSVVAIEKSDITALGIPAQDTTYNFADDYDGTTNKGATEATVRNAVSNAINALDKTENSTGGTNIEIRIVEEKGLIKEIKVVTDNTVNATDVNTAIETALANYGGFKVVQLTSDTPPVPDVQNPSEKYIYLTKDSQSSARDPYTEWIYIKGDASAVPPTQSHWEVIGETSVDLSNYIQKVSGATENNFAAFTPDGAIKDSGKKAADFATAAQGTKADSSVQSVSINNGTAINPGSNGNVNLPLASTTDPGAMSASDKSKLEGINNYIESATVAGRTLTLTPKTGSVVTFNDTGDINVIEKISVNGTQQTVTNKEVALTIPAAANNATITLKVGGAAAGDTTPVSGDFTVDQSNDEDIVIPAAVSASGNDPAKPGVMSSADKDKLDNIASNADVNVIEGVKLAGESSRLTPDANKDVTIPEAAVDSSGGTSAYSHGLMSASDKEKLDNLKIFKRIQITNGGSTVAHIDADDAADTVMFDTGKGIDIVQVGADSNKIQFATTVKNFDRIKVSDGATPTPSVVDVTAEDVNQSLTLVAGDNIVLTPDNTNKSVTISSSIAADLGYIYGKATVVNPASQDDLLNTSMTGYYTTPNNRFLVAEDQTDHHVYLYALKSSSLVNGVDMFSLNINSVLQRGQLVNGYYYYFTVRVVNKSGNLIAESNQYYPSQVGESTVNMSLSIKNSDSSVTTIDGREYYAYRIVFAGDAVTSPDTMGIVTTISAIEETCGFVEITGGSASLTPGDAINIANDTIDVKYGKGLGLDANNQLEVKAGEGLTYNSEGGITYITLDSVTEAVVNAVQKLNEDLDTKLTTNFSMPLITNKYDFADRSVNGINAGAGMLCQAFTVPINNQIRLGDANSTEPTLFGIYATQAFDSNRKIMLALYVYDFETQSTDYVADTGPVTVVAGRNEYPIKHLNPNITELKSNCVYYATLYLPSASNANGLYLVGCPSYTSASQINAIPRFTVGVDNITYNGSEISMASDETGRLDYKDGNNNYYIGPWTSSYNERPDVPRFFMQIRNAAGNYVIVTEPFTNIPTYTLGATNTINDVFGSIPSPSGDDVVFQEVRPYKDVYIKGWTFYDTKSGDTNNWGGRVYSSGFDTCLTASLPSGVSITATHSEVGASTGIYAHHYEFTGSSFDGIKLDAYNSYRFPAALAYGANDKLVQYTTPNTVKKTLHLFDDGADIRSSALFLRENDAVGTCITLTDKNGNSWTI